MKQLMVVAGLFALSLLFVACGGNAKEDGILGGLERPTGVISSEPTPDGRTPVAAASPTVRADREEWQAAMMDESKSLPGEYVAPHPGADGNVCDNKSCSNRHDDRNHVNGTVPICTQAQLTAKSYSNPLCYNSNPPTSGPHAAQFAQNRVYDEPVSKEQLVHAMEHSSVIIWYNTSDANVIRTLAQITNGANQSRKFVVMSRYEGMEANTIALTSWTRLDKFPVSQFRDQRVLDFINAHSRRYNPEGF